MGLDPQSTVGDIVRERPARSRVFEQLRIDFCCSGKLTLADACTRRNLEVADVLDQLQRSDEQEAQRGEELVDADALSLTDLADHIEQTHHAYLRAELPRLNAMTQRVMEVHGGSDPRLVTVRQAFQGLQSELTSHMMKEEQVLFPMIRQLEASSDSPSFHCGSIANPIRQMEAEHDSAGSALAVMHDATDGYSPPDWACNTYRAMLDGLATLQQDLHQHIHKENNVLFPKAIDLEQRRCSGAPTSV